jgi:hypothetical protein
MMRDEAGKKRSLKRWLLIVASLAIVLPLALAILALAVLSSGVADNRIRSEITGQIAKRLSTSAELADSTSTRGACGSCSRI